MPDAEEEETWYLLEPEDHSRVRPFLFFRRGPPEVWWPPVDRVDPLGRWENEGGAAQ